MSKVKLFKEVKRAGPKKNRENSYYNFEQKKRIYYECVIVESNIIGTYNNKGFHEGLPTGEPKVEVKPKQVEVDGNTDSKDSDSQASA